MTQNISYQLTGLINGQTYYFVVRAQDPSGNEDNNTVEISVTPTINANSIVLDAKAYWKFKEGSGYITADETGNNNDGNINGASWSAGKVDNALIFDGINDYVKVEDSPSLRVTGDITLEGWFKTTVNDGSDDGLIGKWGANGHDYLLWTYRGNIIFDSAGSLFAIRWIGGMSNLADGNWHHLVITCNGTTGIIYFDGVKKAMGTVPAIPTSANPFYIGTYDAREVSSFPGQIDEVVVYDRALTSAEVQTRFSGVGADTSPPVFSGLVTAVDTQIGGAVDLSWSPASDSSIPITYNIYYATSPGGYGFANAVTQNTSYRVTGLTNNQRYYFVVRAQNALGNEDDNMVELSTTPTLNVVIP